MIVLRLFFAGKIIDVLFSNKIEKTLVNVLFNKTCAFAVGQSDIHARAKTKKTYDND